MRRSLIYQRLVPNAGIAIVRPACLTQPYIAIELACPSNDDEELIAVALDRSSGSQTVLDSFFPPTFWKQRCQR